MLAIFRSLPPGAGPATRSCPWCWAELCAEENPCPVCEQRWPASEAEWLELERQRDAERGEWLAAFVGPGPCEAWARRDPGRVLS